MATFVVNFYQTRRYLVTLKVEAESLEEALDKAHSMEYDEYEEELDGFCRETDFKTKKLD